MKKDIKLPDFLVVGAAKSGTTYLWKRLSEIDRIYLPSIKECRFFSQMKQNYKGGVAASFTNEGPRNIAEYVDLFKGSEEKICGDISNDYLYYYDRTIPFIKKTYKEAGFDDPKIIIVLREPVSRVFSQYNHTVRLGSERNKFKDAFNLSKEKINKGYAWSFDLQGIGLSYDSVKAYKNAFDSVQVYLMEDIVIGSGLSDIISYLDIDNITLKNDGMIENANHYKKPKSVILNEFINSFIPSHSIKIKSYVPDQVYKYLRKIKYRINVVNLNSELVLSVEEYAFLKEYYKNDVVKLGSLIGRDLSSWMDA